MTACSGTRPPAPRGILNGSVQTTTFEQVTKAVDDLYREHPEISSYQTRGVTYNTETRDKVLKVCRDGGLAGDAAQRESQRVLACAPLILFFYDYGKESGVQTSTDVARYLYWYAEGNNSQKTVVVLTDLLKSWEIE